MTICDDGGGIGGAIAWCGAGAGHSTLTLSAGCWRCKACAAGNTAGGGGIGRGGFTTFGSDDGANWCCGAGVEGCEAEAVKLPRAGRAKSDMAGRGGTGGIELLPEAAGELLEPVPRPDEPPSLLANGEGLCR